MLQNRADNRRLPVGNAVNVKLNGVCEELVYQNRLALGNARRLFHILAQAFLVVDDGHAASAKHEARPHQHGIAYLLRDPDGVRAIVADRARAAIRNGEVEPFFAFPDEDDALYPRPRAQAAVPIYALSEEGRGGCEPELYLVLRLGIDPQSGALRIETPTVLMPWMMANNRTVLEGIRQRWRQDSYGRVA